MFFESCGAWCALGSVVVIPLGFFRPSILGGVVSSFIFRRLSPWAGGLMGVFAGLFAGVSSIDFLTSGEWRDAANVAGITFLAMVASCFNLGRVLMFLHRTQFVNTL